MRPLVPFRPLVTLASAGLALGLGASTLFGFGQLQSSPSLSSVPVAHAQASTFQDTFSGKPSGPTPYRPANWDILVHSRDVSTWQQPESMMGAHGSDCAAYPATHLVSQYADTVFQCNDHLMTAIQAGGYGAIYMSPNQLVDFSSGEASVKFDLSTIRSSHRDWVDVWITPYEDNVPAPLDNWLPDLTGLPKRGIRVRMGQFNGNTVFGADLINNFTATELPSNWWTGYESFLTPSGVRRDTFELKLSRTGLKFGMPGYNFSWIDTQFPGLDWSRGVVQLSHHSYNPTKECDMPVCAANTWHWDNVQISPAVPFTILAADRTSASPTNSTVTFAGPAPENSYLRFLGIGGNLQASLDGGPWQSFGPRQTSRTSEETFKPYWLPVPAGTRQVTFRGSDWYAGPWNIADPAIWSLTAPGSSQGSVATATSTAAAATVTATPTGTPAEQAVTATPTSAASPAASATPTSTVLAATATSTAAPATATHLPATATPTTTTSATATPTASAGGSSGPNGSLRLTGSAYVSVPNVPEVNLTGDWTAELWFKDEYTSRVNFNHPPQTLLIVGNTDTEADIPLLARIEWGGLTVGDRRDWTDQYAWYDLQKDGVNPSTWHHVAMTKSASTRRVQVVFDGQLVLTQTLPGQNPSTNGRGLSIGRSTKQSWRGNLDDVRIWNVVRPVADIAATFRTELTTAPAGLVANWKLNETAGTSIADSAGSPQTGTLRNNGGTWTTDVHP